jgi:hypothetical protein
MQAIFRTLEEVAQRAKQFYEIVKGYHYSVINKTKGDQTKT